MTCPEVSNWRVFKLRQCVTRKKVYIFPHIFSLILKLIPKEKIPYLTSKLNLQVNLVIRVLENNGPPAELSSIWG